MHVDLARDFVVDGLLDVAERIDVLDLGARAELLGADLAHRHVGVAAERAFLHVAVADLEIANQRVHFLEIGHGFFRRAHVGLGDDFDERRAGAVEVDAGLLRQAFMQRLAGVFFQVRTRDTDTLLCAIVEHDVHVTLANHRQLVLADLVTLGQIRIEVVLAREHRTRRDLGIDGQPEFHRHAHGFAVEHRQHARIGEIDEIRLRIGPLAVGRGGSREDLRLRRELRVDLEADDGFPAHHSTSFTKAAGILRCQSVSFW